MEEQEKETEVIEKPQNSLHIKLENRWELDLNSFDSMTELLDYAEKIKKNFFNENKSGDRPSIVG